jgi:phage terminase Nu1 subunit (DNA packaging protein)
MDDVYLTPVQLGQRWKMSTNTLQNWRVQGLGPKFVKMGEGRSSRVLYHLDDVLTYEAQRKARAQS